MATKKDSKKEILKVYSNSLLLDAKPLNSIYELCTKAQIDEAEFYKHFSSFQAIEKGMLHELMESSLEVLKKSEEYETYDTKGKLLSFYFTFFETLTLNRSLFLKLLNPSGNKMKQLATLDAIKPSFLGFINELNISLTDFNSDNLQKVQEKTIEVSAWSQLLLTIKFWMDDTSAGFEKTDMFIEKSIHTSFNLLKNDTLSSVIDFGKFIFKERIQKMKA